MDARGWWRGAVARVAAAARRAVAARAARGRPGAGRRLLGWLGATVARRWLLPLAGAALAGLTRAWLGRRRRAASWPGGGRRAGERTLSSLAMEMGREIMAESRPGAGERQQGPEAAPGAGRPVEAGAGEEPAAEPPADQAFGLEPVAERTGRARVRIAGAERAAGGATGDQPGGPEETGPLGEA